MKEQTGEGQLFLEGDDGDIVVEVRWPDIIRMRDGTTDPDVTMLRFSLLCYAVLSQSHKRP